MGMVEWKQGEKNNAEQRKKKNWKRKSQCSSCRNGIKFMTR